jgi:hypothetical protein
LNNLAVSTFMVEDDCSRYLETWYKAKQCHAEKAIIFIFNPNSHKKNMNIAWMYLD